MHFTSRCLIPALLCLAFGLFSCGTHDYLGGGKTLAVEKLPYVIIPDDPQDPGNKIEFDDLFLLDPGTIVPRSSYTGGVDPVMGTDIFSDFDNDGLINEDEMAFGNIWVADYPLVEATIAPPVMMQIELFLDGADNSTTFNSEISSDDVEDNIEKGTESVHRNEINTRTVQFQDTYNKQGSATLATSVNMSMSANVNVMGSGAGASYSMGSNVSTSISSAYGETKNKWKDVPFKDNLGKEAKSLKRSEAAKKSRNLRNEIRNSYTQTVKMKPNAGYVRAALYIQNHSINMPVRLSNIRCTLMFETPEGQLLPGESFRLREDDYSLLKIDVYGGQLFGPYVISLEGLNTYEIKDAISKGYNPKIFIVGFDMSHVPDSDYRNVLGDRFTGNNLQVIEEKAKGRTAGIKLSGPGFRHFFRVAAFEVMNGDPINPQPLPEGRNMPTEAEVDNLRAGVSLEKALTRITYSGMEIEFADYILDFSGLEGVGSLSIPVDPDNPDAGTTACFHVRSVKSINGRKNKLPILAEVDEIDESGVPTGKKAYLMKPLKDWTDAEKIKCGLWVVFDQGVYYRHPGEFGKNPIFNALAESERKDLDTFSYQRLSDPENPDSTEMVTEIVPRVQGITGLIWPGDHYDIVYISMAEILGIPDRVMNELVGVPDDTINMVNILTQTSTMGTEKKEFGYNPIESEEVALGFNTRWKSEELGERPFIPNVRSQYLGTAIEGDTVEIEINLDETKYLNPSFGSPEIIDARTRVYNYTDFSYSMIMDPAIYPFDYEEALDFEISFAINGRQGDWLNLIPERSPYCGSYWYEAEENSARTYLGGIKYSWDYLDQNFTVRFTVPYGLPGIEDDSTVDLYLRTAPNNAYRESIWPLKYDEVKKFRGRVASVEYNNNPLDPRTTIITEYNAGEIAPGDDLRINDRLAAYDVISVDDSKQDQYEIVVAGDAAAMRLDWAMVNLNEPLDEPEMQLSREGGFFGEWNSELEAHADHQPLLTGNTVGVFSPVRSLGYDPGFMVANWLGNNNFGNPSWNNWANAGSWNGFIDRIFDSFLATDSGYSFSLLPCKFDTADDFLLSTTNTYDQSSPVVRISGDRALVVWESDNGSNRDIYGRILNVNTGAGLGNNFLISTTNANNQRRPQVEISGGRALVVWESNDNGSDNNIRGRIIDMAAGAPIGNDFLVSITTANTQESPRLGISGDLAMVVWESNYGTTFDIRGRIIVLSLGAGQTNPEFTVNSTVAYNQNNPDISVTGDSALVAWESMNSSGNDDIRGRIFTMSSGTANGSDFLVSSTVTNDQWYPKVSASGDRALVVWWSSDNGSTALLEGDIRGRFIDMTTAESQSGAEILVSTTTRNSQWWPRLSMADDKAFVVWESNDTGMYDIRGRMIDMIAKQGIGNDFLVNTTTEDDQRYPDICISGNQALVVWTSENGTDFDIRGRIIRMNTGSGMRNDFLLSSTGMGDQEFPKSVIAGNQALVVWQSGDNGSNDDIRGITFELATTGNALLHGLSNFFVSPMIERDYTVKARIIDPLSE